MSHSSTVNPLVSVPSSSASSGSPYASPLSGLSVPQTETGVKGGESVSGASFELSPYKRLEQGVNPVEMDQVWKTTIDTELQNMQKSEKLLNQSFERITRGKHLTNDEYLQLQHAMYAHHQSISVVSKVIQQATSSLKQILQTQI